MCIDTAYILDLSVNIFSLTHALTKVFNVTPQKEIIVLKKNAAILKFEERLDHENFGSYLLATRFYASPNDTIKTHSEGKNMEGKTLMKAEGTAENTTNTSIKHKKQARQRSKKNKWNLMR